MSDSRPIGIFDSGIGGFSVLGIAQKIMPNERFIYLADRARMPYGVKTANEIVLYATQCVDILIAMNCKCVAVACNTATENAIDILSTKFSTVPIIGLEPAITPCVSELSRNGYGIALVTTATANSLRLKNTISNSNGKIKVVPLPTLARIIENNALNSVVVVNSINSVLSQYPDVESVILGCSHYSLITEHVKNYYNGKIKIYDGACVTAQKIKSVIDTNGLNCPINQKGSVRFFSTNKAAIDG